MLSTTELMPALRTSTSGAAASTVTDSSSRANAEHRIDRRRRAHLQHDARLPVGPESLKRHLELVRPGRKVRQQVAAGPIGHGRPNEARVGLRHGDGHARQHAAAFIANRAAQLRRRLRPGGAGGQQKDQCAAQTTGHTSLHDVNSSCPLEGIRSPHGASGCGAPERALAELAELSRTTGSRKVSAVFGRLLYHLWPGLQSQFERETAPDVYSGARASKTVIYSDYRALPGRREDSRPRSGGMA